MTQPQPLSPGTSTIPPQIAITWQPRSVYEPGKRGVPAKERYRPRLWRVMKKPPITTGEVE